jgi:hypothetical protein
MWMLSSAATLGSTPCDWLINPLARAAAITASTVALSVRRTASSTGPRTSGTATVRSLAPPGVIPRRSDPRASSCTRSMAASRRAASGTRLRHPFSALTTAVTTSVLLVKVGAK